VVTNPKLSVPGLMNSTAPKLESRNTLLQPDAVSFSFDIDTDSPPVNLRLFIRRASYTDIVELLSGQFVVSEGGEAYRVVIPRTELRRGTNTIFVIANGLYQSVQVEKLQALELELTNYGSQLRAIAVSDVEEEALNLVSYLEKINGTVDIPLGAETVEVTGLNLTDVPQQVRINVLQDEAGDYLDGGVINGSKTTDGFTVKLSGPAPTPGYAFDYLIVMSASEES
jgi:hypothetical protein